jgi:hypothetical protein
VTTTLRAGAREEKAWYGPIMASATFGRLPRHILSSVSSGAASAGSLLMGHPATAAGIDFGALAADLDRVFRGHGARTQTSSLDVVFHRTRGSLATIASFVLESERIARAVVSHVRVAPLFAGIAITVHPHPTFDAPLLLADVMVPPPGSTRAFLDACGPSIARPGFDARFREPLAAIADSLAGAEGITRTTVPEWIAPLSGGSGARLRARRGHGDAIARVLVRYVDGYLTGLETAPRAADPSANAASARTVRDVMRANGPAAKHLTRSFGEGYTARYMRLLWREDTPA